MSPRRRPGPNFGDLVGALASLNLDPGLRRDDTHLSSPRRRPGPNFGDLVGALASLNLDPGLRRDDATVSNRGPPATSRSWTVASLLLRLVLLALVFGNVRAPRGRFDRARRLPHDVELAIRLYFADEHRLVQMMVLL